MVNTTSLIAAGPVDSGRLRYPSLERISMLAINGHGLIEQASQSCHAMLGYEGNQLVGRPVSEIAGWDSRCSHPRDQLELFADRLGGVATWVHARGYTVRTIIASLARMSGSDSIVVLGLKSVTVEVAR